MDFKKEPISNVKWVKVDELNSNDYNPNIVGANEMKGLKNNILNNGWIFPIVVNKEGIIIDGYHRSFLAKNDKDILKKYNGMVPIVQMDISNTDAMCLTVAMNAAKGVHKTKLMHTLITKLVKEYNVSKVEVAERCVMDVKEVDLLLKEGVFDKLNIDAHTYSQAWVPKRNL